MTIYFKNAPIKNPDLAGLDKDEVRAFMHKWAREYLAENNKTYDVSCAQCGITSAVLANEWYCPECYTPY